MALSIPPELKKISAYIRRAEELDKDASAESRIVAYYCRQYAVHAGIPLASTSPAAKECLGALLGALETEKAAMDNFTREEAKFLCAAFATKVFNQADEEDRLGVANKATAKTFYAAATFLQILEQFSDEGDADMEETKKRVVYSKWKSTEILKAMKEGRTPAAGGYGEDEEGGEEENEKDGQESQEDGTTDPSAPKVETVDDDEDDGAGGDLGIPPAPHAPPMPPMEPPAVSEEEDDENPEEGTEVEFLPPPSFPTESSPNTERTFVAPPEPPSAPSPPPPEPPVTPPPAYQPPAQPKQKGGIFGFGKKKAGKVSKAQMEDAVELTRFALAALDDRDADLAADRLQQALQSLGR